ncbi:hypothetical protein [Aneurinibacillus aneurinilyticus]|uniref:hypothetical protein n=1 Tax=Aneurinibacillus aneurinilyticus TaxID=1391 RepID=UPI0035251198
MDPITTGALSSAAGWVTKKGLDMVEQYYKEQNAKKEAELAQRKRQETIKTAGMAAAGVAAVGIGALVINALLQSGEQEEQLDKQKVTEIDLTIEKEETK